MCEKWNEFMEKMEEREFTVAEAILTVLTAFLLGMVIGIFCSPKKRVMIGSNNGNNSGNGCGCDCDCDCEEWDEEEED